MKILSDKDFIIIDSFEHQEINTFHYFTDEMDALSIQTDIYDSSSNILLNSINESVSRFAELGFIKINEENQTVEIDTEKALNYYNFFDGTYRVEFKFYKNILGTEQDSDKLFIQKISSSRKEIFINYINANERVNFLSFSKSNFYRFSRKIILNKFINLGNNKLFLALNAKNQTDSSNENLIIKLYEPLPKDVLIKDVLWIVEFITNPVEDFLILKYAIEENLDKYIILKSPNFNSNYDGINIVKTKYKSYNQLIDTSSLGSNYFAYTNPFQVNEIDGIDLNIKYEEFNNFVHFGSATQMLENFRTKLSALEFYNQELNKITSSLLQKNIVASSSLNYTLKKNEIIGSFTKYEKFLYFNSGSYFTSSLYIDENSIGINIDVTWPKSGSFYPSVNYSASISPYTLYDTDSTQVENWYATMSSIAFEYDYYNRDSLYQTMPEHIKSNVEFNYDYIKFVNMIGEFYDNVWLYISNFTRTLKRENKIGYGAPRELLWNILKNYGLNLNQGQDLVDLSRYDFGYYTSGSFIKKLDIEERQITEEIWNRILNNYPYIFKSKGTKKSIISSLNCYGITTSLIRIQEFGGPVVTGSISGSSQYSFEYQDFTHVINMSSSYISIPWITSSYDSMKPDGIEFKFRASHVDASTLDLFSLTGSTSGEVSLKLIKEYNEFGKLILNVGVTQITSSVKPFYNGEFYSVLVKRGTETDSTSSQNYHLQIKSYDQYINRISVDENIYAAASSSAYVNSTILYMGGNPVSSNKLIGSFDEIRLWAEVLEDDTFDYHTKYSVSTNGNELISAVSGSLAFRLSFNLPYDLNSTSSMLNEAYLTSSYNVTASFVGFPSASEYPFQFSDYERSNIIENRFIFSDMENQKVRIEKNYIRQYFDSGSLRLYPLRGNYYVDGALPEGEISEFDNSPVDVDTLLIGFTPVDFINKDILAFYGNNDLLGVYGDFYNIYESSYPSNDYLNNLYYKNTKSAIATFDEYLTYIKTYDKSLFTLLKELVPAKASLIMGTVYEQNILRRNRVKLMNREKANLYPEYIFAINGIPNINIKSDNDSIIDSSIYSKRYINLSNNTIDMFESSVIRNTIDIYGYTLEMECSKIIYDVNRYNNIFIKENDVMYDEIGIIDYLFNKFKILSYFDGNVNRQRYGAERNNIFAQSTKNSSLTTSDKLPAVIITVTNPRKLVVNYADSPKLRVDN